MPKYEELNQQASDLRYAGKFAQALPIFREIWTNSRDLCNECDGWGYAFTLRKLGRSREALEICREVYRVRADFQKNLDLYGWCIYDTELAKCTDENVKVSENQILKAANAIFELTAPGQYSPYLRSFFKVIDYYGNRPNYPADAILAWTDRMNPDDLSAQEGHKTGDDGRPTYYASDREKWYAARCKALLEAGRHMDCIEIGRRALAEFTRFHYDNDVWFGWRMALAQVELGQLQEALDRFISLLPRKREWFILHRIAQTAYDLGTTDEALPYALEAALAPGDTEHKWKLFFLMSRVYGELNDPSHSEKHLILAAKLHEEQGWKLPSELESALSSIDQDLSEAPSSRELVSELRRDWQSASAAQREYRTGKIFNLLPHGKAGFVRGDDGADYHFRVQAFKGPRHQIQVGQKVKFFSEHNPDPKKCDNIIEVMPI